MTIFLFCFIFFPLCADNFHFHIGYFFVTKFVTHITKFVTHVRKFVTLVTKFVIKIFKEKMKILI